MTRKPRWWPSVVVGGALLCACAGPATAPASPGAGDSQSAARGSKSLTVGVTSAGPALGAAGGVSPIGGWVTMTEIHSDGLVTADFKTRKPIGRLAERVPSLDDGSISVLPDGQMRVAFSLRKGVT